MERARNAGAHRVGNTDCLKTLISKQLMPLGLLLVFAYVITQKAAELDFAAIGVAVAQIEPWQWGVSIGAAIVSFWAIGRMDVVMHRLLATGVSPLIAQLSGIASVASAQIAGFGLLTGTLARWRILPEMPLLKATQITVSVSTAFMASLAALTAVMAMLVDTGLPWLQPAAWAVLAAVCAFLAVSLWRPRMILRLKLPPLKAQISLLTFALLDTGAAALALYVLLPAGVMPPAEVFYTVFLLALGAGLLGATPGGVGPFEMMFLACLPSVPEAPMLAAIMGYRLVYFALPAIFSVVLLVAAPALNRRAAPAPQPSRMRSTPPRPAVAALSFTAPRAEAGLMRQGEFDLMLDGQDRPVSMVARSGQSLIMLSDSLRRDMAPDDTVAALHALARQRFLTPCLYKCSARLAAAARRAGWWVLPVAQEAWVPPREFSTDGPQRRQLRRFLRKADASGLRVIEANGDPPLDDMARVAEAWGAGRQGARGFSMGRFDPDYVRGQRLYLAYDDPGLVGFLTLHDGAQERTVDLMCQTAAAPAGTMHRLVTQAIEDARAEGCSRLSLAAVPRLADALPLPAALAARVDRMTGAQGLMRFKSSFAPRWEPLYIAAPGPVGLGMAGLDLADRITRPRELVAT